MTSGDEARLRAKRVLFVDGDPARGKTEAYRRYEENQANLFQKQAEMMNTKHRLFAEGRGEDWPVVGQPYAHAIEAARSKIYEEGGNDIEEAQAICVERRPPDFNR